MDSDDIISDRIEMEMDSVFDDEDEARILKAERKRKRKAEKKALAERAIAEALAVKKKSDAKGKGTHKGPSMPARPYKKWPDEKLDAFISDMNTKISMLDDKILMYNIRLRGYSLEKTHRGGE